VSCERYIQYQKSGIRSIRWNEVCTNHKSGGESGGVFGGYLLYSCRRSRLLRSLCLPVPSELSRDASSAVGAERRGCTGTLFSFLVSLSSPRYEGVTGKNIQTRRPSRKLNHKNQEPFQEEKIVSPLAVKLPLPRKWRIHNVFHASLVEPYRSRNLRAAPDPAKILQEADNIENSAEYDVDEIMDSTKKG